MSVFKCKMCGGAIELNEDATIGICLYCGTKQTLPRLDDDRRANLYDRANHFRRNNEFDKAAGIYEQILNEDKTDAEAYWSLVLCHYGIEYVEDQVTHKRVPTVNRTQYTSIFDNEDYKSALQYASKYQRSIYEEEANAINEIQKNILAISQKEDPFDVFICYKETDSAGRRTPDSVLANELYHQLIQEGFKVFFSRITLEDKLGTAYEPYIFAALNSAKVMVVLGTKPDYFNSVWVKNEWSRFLSLVRISEGKKVLIPAYKDMDPYDLPEEFAHLQAQDMSKLGFMQDLIRGIKKISLSDEKVVVTKEASVISTDTNIAPLLKRAFMFLEDGNFNDADSYCERVLDQDPENAEAYLGKIMANLHVCRRESLADCDKPFDSNNNYQKAVRFGSDSLRAELKGYIDYINERNENARCTDIYDRALRAMNKASSETAYKSAADIFKTIPGFKDADDLADKCLERAKTCHNNDIYDMGKARMLDGTIEGYVEAINRFCVISGWKDVDALVIECKKNIEEIKIRDEKERLERERKQEQAKMLARKKIRILSLCTLIVGFCFVCIIIWAQVIVPKHKLAEAMTLLDSGDYEAAYSLFEEIGNNDAIASSKYERAVMLIEYKDYESAYRLLNGLNYRDSEELLKEIFPKCAEWMKVCPVGETLFFGSYEQDNIAENGNEDIEWIVIDRDDTRVLVISKYAIDMGIYDDSFMAVWGKSSLCSWLNNEFFVNAFSEEEAMMIQSEMFGKYDSKIFILNKDEIKIYFDHDSDRKCMGTDYCNYCNKKATNDGLVNWWTRGRDSFNQSENFCFVTSMGGFEIHGQYDANLQYGIRPAMWISIEGL